MSSAGVIVWAMSFVLVCLVAMPPASAASGSGGILHIPSAASLAHCPASCGGVNISYPFGIGAGCFRQDFELTSNHTTRPPRLFLGNSTTQITDIYGASVEAPMFFNITLGSGMNSYSMSWEAPAKGITISGCNDFFVLGCYFDTKLFDYVGNPVGSCMSRCHVEVLPTQGPCNGTGCCAISLQQDISGYQATIVPTDGMAAQPDSIHPGIMAFMASGYYRQNATDLFSSWTNASMQIGDAVLEVAIMDQPSCESAQMNNASYGCATDTDSYCINASYGGYTCHCYNNYVSDMNAYLSEGCTPATQQVLPACFSIKPEHIQLQSSCSYSLSIYCGAYYNPKPKEHCRRSCGNMSIPFPFELEEDCVR